LRCTYWLTVIVPVYNEVATIDEVLRRVLAAPFDKQVIVVDDGSTDGTTARLAAFASSLTLSTSGETGGDGESGRTQAEILTHPTNRGKGAAIRTGLARACGRFTLVQDADLEYDPNDYTRVLEPLLEGRAQVVYGSRYSSLSPPGGGEGAARRPDWRFRSGVRLLNWCVRLLYGVRLTDEATCYKAFPTEILRAMDLRCERFEFCPEVTAKACRMGLTIHEVPIRYSPRTAKEGKKIGVRDGVAALRELWKWRRWVPTSKICDQPIEPLRSQSAAA
jgi:glycosyltransferase involved in cell wall biosynthesis